MVIRSVEEDDKEDENKVETQLNTQLFRSQSEDRTPQPQDLEVEKAVVQKRKRTISQTPDPTSIAKRVRGTRASQISSALNNVAQEFARNREQKEIDRIEKLPAIERAILVLEDQYPKPLAQLDVLGYTRLLENLQSKQSLFSKAEVFLLMKDKSDIRNLFVEELFQDVNSE
jgi:hypothetical protein